MYFTLLLYTIMIILKFNQNSKNMAKKIKGSQLNKLKFEEQTFQTLDSKQ